MLFSSAHPFRSLLAGSLHTPQFGSRFSLLYLHSILGTKIVCCGTCISVLRIARTTLYCSSLSNTPWLLCVGRMWTSTKSAFVSARTGYMAKARSLQRLLSQPKLFRFRYSRLNCKCATRVKNFHTNNLGLPMILNVTQQFSFSIQFPWVYLVPTPKHCI